MTLQEILALAKCEIHSWTPKLDADIPRVYDAHAEQPAKKRSAWKPQIEYMTSLIGTDGVVLDAGCGTGLDAKVFRELPCRYVGIDRSGRSLALARSHVPSTEFMMMDMRHLAFAPESFDGLWVCCSFQNLSRNHAPHALKGFHRALKRKGVLFLTALEVFDDHETIEVRSWLFGTPMEFMTSWQEREFQSLVSASGFDFLHYQNNSGLMLVWAEKK